MVRHYVVQLAALLFAVIFSTVQIGTVYAQEPTVADHPTEAEVSVSLEDQGVSIVSSAGAKAVSPENEEIVPLGNGELDARDAKYQTYLPLVTTEDSGTVQNEEELNAAAVNAYWRTLKYESFEGAFPNSLWRSYDCNGATGGYQNWDDTSYKYYGGRWSAWPSSGGRNGVSPWSSNYPNYACTWMIYGPFSLRYAQAAHMIFNLWFQTELNYDFIEYHVSCDGTNFTGWKHSGNSNGWTSKTLDLGRCRGDSTVWAGFRFVSDYSVTAKGPFIDNVYIQEYR